MFVCLKVNTSYLETNSWEDSHFAWIFHANGYYSEAFCTITYEHQKNECYTGFWGHLNKRETGTNVQISVFFRQWKPQHLQRITTVIHDFPIISQLNNKFHVLNTLILYWENTGERVKQLSYWVLLVEDLFVKYGTVVEHKCHGDIHQPMQCCDLRTDVSLWKPAKRKEVQATERMCHVLQAWEEEGHAILVRDLWCGPLF
jgi:hypothetical protein